MEEDQETTLQGGSYQEWHRIFREELGFTRIWQSHDTTAPWSLDWSRIMRHSARFQDRSKELGEENSVAAEIYQKLREAGLSLVPQTESSVLNNDSESDKTVKNFKKDSSDVRTSSTSNKFNHNDILHDVNYCHHFHKTMGFGRVNVKGFNGDELHCVANGVQSVRNPEFPGKTGLKYLPRSL